MAAPKAQKLIVNRTLQFKDQEGNSTTVTASDQPQQLPGDIAKEALDRGWATKPAPATNTGAEDAGVTDTDADSAEA